MSSELVKKEPNVLEIIQQAVASGQDVEVLRGLLDLQKDFMRFTAEQSFNASMARLQAKLPQINKDGRIVVGNVERSRYARLEDIDVAIRPLLAEEGFSFSFDEEEFSDSRIRFAATLSHKDGHSVVKRLSVPVDKAAVGQRGPVRTAIQDAGSTSSYARRYLIKMHLNLVERDEDIDGNDLATIDNEQELNLSALISEVGADRAKFLHFMGVAELSQIPAREYQKAMNLLETKRKR
jgi:hypothetical protein